MTHIGSGYGPEIEASFDVLKELVNQQTCKMTSFIIFLKVLFLCLLAEPRYARCTSDNTTLKNFIFPQIV